MLDSSLDRFLSFRLAIAADCWGRRRSLKSGTRNGIWFVTSGEFDQPLQDDAIADPAEDRAEILQRFIDSGVFTTTEIATLQALAIERLTVAELAERDGCTRQAVMARLAGNSRGQGGILRKARALLATSGAALHES